VGPGVGDELDSLRTTARLGETAEQNSATARPHLVLAATAGYPTAPSRPRFSELHHALNIGRGEDTTANNLQIVDPSLSRNHASLRERDGHWTLIDNGSTNGTYVDGERLGRDPVVLRPGSVIVMGNLVFVFRLLTATQIAAVTRGFLQPFGQVPTFSGDTAVRLEQLRKLASSDLDLLITGQTGAGKEIYARATHKSSGRTGPFVAINCSAIPDTLIESELFGYRKGAHSAADRSKPGLIEQAEGGTLFLDEIGDMSSSAQSKILRFLQEREYWPLGAQSPQKLNVRVIGATLRGRSESGDEPGLRPDLAARLEAVPVVLPTLRERVEDMGLLADHFLRGSGKQLSVEALRLLFFGAWPGNIRAFERALQSAVVLAGAEDTIKEEHLPGLITETTDTLPTLLVSRTTAEDADARSRRAKGETPGRAELESLLIAHNGSVPEVARALDRQRTLVWRWVKKYEIDVAKFRA